MKNENTSCLLTIIVPAYNVEKYIDDCLISLINQTVINHKVIIINDGSTDKTEDICLSYEKNYPGLITLISQPNQGLGEARNVGMKLVETPFVAFLDSDDWLNRRYVECFSKLINETDELPDITFTLPWIYDAVTRRILPWHDKEKFDTLFEVIDNKSTIKTNVMQKPELYEMEVNACRKIYKTSFLKKVGFTFPKGLKWEDVPGHFYLLHEANTVMALPEVGFFYRVNQGGTITAGTGATRLDMVPIFEQLLEVQNQLNFTRLEKAYVIRLIQEFTEWSLDVISTDYVSEFLEGIHNVFLKFNQADIDYYIRHLCDKYSREYERGLFTCLRSTNYNALTDYYTREQEIRNFANKGLQNKKDILRSGRNWIKERGLGYVIKRSFSKYLLKR